ncbi:MAG: hypothetical protein ASARMPREDX12_006721 [Alectoria sarmentosa]|nr:MAG: hypothetical protein ASARMPREDX12_006721 [Alectoria sarmentosa]
MSSDSHSQSQRPQFLRKGSSTVSAKQKVVNLSELGLLPRKDGQRPANRRNNSSQAVTRPTYTPTQSHNQEQPARPQYNRQKSAVSTHSASGRPHPPVYHPPEPKKPKNRKTLLSRIAAQQIAREPNPAYSNGTATSFNWRSGRPMAGMLEIERSRTRRERTFIGSECAVCEEPLEHTLRGERILQFSCGHVSHEACFYEYIKEFESQYCPTCNAPLGLDTSRGGNVLDLEKLSSIVRSVSQNNEARDNHQRNGSGNGSSSRIITPVPWDPQTGQERPSSRGSNHRNTQRESSHPQDARQMEREKERQNRDMQRERIERYGSQNRGQQHKRNESANTGGVHSSGEYSDTHNNHNHTGRRHDYDVQSMETALSSPRASVIKNPIPAPTVTVRSEYPTLTRSRQQQSLTCLVTIEVPEGKWRPDPADLRGAPVLPSMQQDSATFSNRPASPAKSQQADWGYESPEVLEEITEDLRVRVDNWHGLDFSRHANIL